MAHARALLTGDRAGVTSYLEADLRRPAEILTAEAVQHHHVRTLIDALPTGSYVVISHATADLLSEALAEQLGRLGQGPAGFQLRGREEIAGLLSGLEFVEPGLVPVSEWRPDPSTTVPPAAEVSCYGTVGRVC